MFSHQYKMGPELGSGKFGRVMQAKDLKNPDDDVAIKLVPRSDMTQSANKEIFALETIPAHPHIIKLKDVARDVRLDGGVYTAMVLQLAPNGELYRHIEKYGHFGEEIARTYFRQLLLALKAAHSVNVYHRDVKLDNVVLGCNYELLLCDFGLSCYCAEETTYCTPKLGTEAYLAPELLERMLYNPAKADIWAATCVLFNLHMGGPPFGNTSAHDWHFRAMRTNRNRFWESHARRSPWVGEGFQKLVERVFAYKEAERPSIDELLADPWMSGPALTDAELTYVMHMRIANNISFGQQKDLK